MTQETKPSHKTLLQVASPSETDHHDHAHPHEDHSHHNHAHGAGGHAHAVQVDADGKVGLSFKLGIALTALFVIVEFGAGLISNSLALISDAGHNLTDVMALAFSWWALLVARRSPNNSKTYGYHRAGILVASFNAATLILIAFYIFIEGVQRLLHPQPVEGWTVISVAAIALVLNSGIALALWRNSKEDLNVRSAFIHILGDALSSVGVIVAGIATLLTGSALFDPLISMLIGIFILWSSWHIIKEAANILLEGIPAGLDMVALMHDLMAIEGVKSVHDLHVWTLGGNFRALSCHILTDTTSLQEANSTAHHIKEMLVDKYDIRHATLELECENCNLPEEVYCTVMRSFHE